MTPDNPQPHESALDSWPIQHQKMAREYVDQVKDLPGILKVVGATTTVDFLFIGTFLDYETVPDETIVDIEAKLTDKFSETRVLFMPFDKQDADKSNLLDLLNHTPEYNAPIVLLEREKQAVPA